MTPSEMVDRLARRIATALGDDFDHAFASKQAWIDARGQSGGRMRDVNEPYQSAYLDAAKEAIGGMREATVVERVALAIEEAMRRDPCMPDVARAAIEAMRQASLAMEKAAQAFIKPYHDIDPQDWRSKTPKDFFRLGWKAMLDEALRE